MCDVQDCSFRIVALTDGDFAKTKRVLDGLCAVHGAEAEWAGRRMNWWGDDATVESLREISASVYPRTTSQEG